MKIKEKILFTKNLSTMIKSGINMVEALDILKSQSTDKKTINLIDSLQKDIKNGQSLSKSMAKFPKAFDGLYLNLIIVGEKSGKIEESLDYIGKQLEKQNELKQKMVSALMYPVLVISAAFIMSGFISLFILPKLVEFFSAFDIELPMTTKILLSFANLMKNHGILIFASIIIISLLFISFTKLKKIKPIWHIIKLKLPVFGRLIKYSQLTSLNRNLFVLLSSGVTITESLKVSSDMLNNEKFKKDLKTIYQSVSKGKSLSQSFSNKKFWQFEKMMIQMIKVGEKTGKLEDNFDYLSKYYENEINTTSKRFATLLEPILLLLIGLLVGFVALAIISPIYELTGTIRR